MVLSPQRVRDYYDRSGPKQDRWAFYEDAAIRDMIAHSDFDKASDVFEFGCGTGRVATRLLTDELHATAWYTAVEVSSTMIQIARSRLAHFGERVKVQQAPAGSVAIQLPDMSLDRVVSTFVLDLLSEDDIGYLLVEAHRTLRQGGRLCLVSLTDGNTRLSSLVSAGWRLTFHLAPGLMGGCRPVNLSVRLNQTVWRLLHRKVIVSFGIPCEVLIAVRDSARGSQLLEMDRKNEQIRNSYSASLQPVGQ